MLSTASAAGVGRSDLPSALERQLGRYADRFQRSVHRLARRHPYLADLAASFPALLFALAVPRNRLDPEPLIARVMAGAPLRQVCEEAGVAWWLRRLGPEAFVRPLPKLPDSADFRRRVANHLSRSPRLAPVWLQAVADAAEIDGEEFILWIACQLARDCKRAKLDRIRQVGLWAWFSNQPGTRGHALIDRPWNRFMSFTAALAAARSWQTKVELYLNLGDEPIADVWLHPCRVAGYDFVPLHSSDQIAEEAVAMRNCVASYGYTLAHNRSRLWSMQRDGRRVATLQVARRYPDPLPSIVQLQTARNQNATVEMWWAARRWLNAHDLPRIRTNERSLLHAAPLHRASWVAFWRPYWLGRRRIPDWLPLSPSRAALNLL
jgi:hypothetical protein